jgi:hypothetical protein
MANAEECFRQGDLSACLTALQADVRRRPEDVRQRIFLVQVLMVLGEWERALTQLGVLKELDATALPMVHSYGAAIQCERLRAAVFRGERSPLLFGEPEPWMAEMVQAVGLQAQGHGSEAAALRSGALEAAPATAGTLNGAPFTTTYANTLADIALYYFTTSLRPTLPTGMVPFDPTNTRPDADRNPNLHMNTYGLTLGVNGTIFGVNQQQTDNPYSYPPVWPNPTQNRNPTAVDDLWHATINGRGQSYIATDVTGTVGVGTGYAEADGGPGTVKRDQPLRDSRIGAPASHRQGARIDAWAFRTMVQSQRNLVGTGRRVDGLSGAQFLPVAARTFRRGRDLFLRRGLEPHRDLWR